MRNHGKGRAISINEPNQGGISEVWKQELGKVAPPVYVFKPLAQWPAVPHPTRQADLDQFRNMPSRAV
ncbi:MAG: hypothetical protein NUV75_02210 [Gallionella sp.]|nr:hypothetical protein [Gallionella sp.]